MRDAIFYEWVPAGSFVRAIVGSVSLVFLCVLSITIVTGVAFQNPLWLVILASALTFILLSFWNYRGIRIQLNREELLVHYGVLNQKSIRLADIVSCETIKASFGRYGGVGVRFGSDGSWAYTTSFGEAVKITLKEGRPFVFSSCNPEKTCDVINKTRAK